MAYVDKSKLMRRIEIEAFRWGEEYDLQQIMGDIEDFPESDVVEIPCRCNECKSFVENKEALVTYCTRECKNLTVNPSDFCSYGERK